MQYEVEAIIGKRQRHQLIEPEYLVKWRNYPIEQSSWQPSKNLKKCPLVELYQTKHAQSQSISIVEAQPNNHSDDSLSPIHGHQAPLLLSQDESNIEKIKEKRMKEESDREQKDSKKCGMPQRVKARSLRTKACQLRIMETAIKYGKTYFKVKEKGRWSWRNRNYLKQFYPFQLCTFYENLIRDRYK